jgi:ketosteroid isomerase-like protein
VKKLAALFAIVLPCVLLTFAPDARANNNDEAQIREALNRWAKAFRNHDLDGIMAMYGPDLVAYDIVPPLQYVGTKAYRKDYEQFLAQYSGPIDVEFRDLHIVAGNGVAFATALERMSGTLKNGQKSEIWVRATTGFRKIKGKWLDVHDHISVPVDMETGKGALDLKP